MKKPREFWLSITERDWGKSTATHVFVMNFPPKSAKNTYVHVREVLPGPSPAEIALEVAINLIKRWDKASCNIYGMPCRSCESHEILEKIRHILEGKE